MKVHLFGASSSPACANYALQRTALDHGTFFSQEARRTILNNFYVDDCLRSSDSEEELLHLAREVKELCAMGGFNLSAFNSNSTLINDAFISFDQNSAE